MSLSSSLQSPTAESDALIRHFAAMSSDRDKVQESITETKIYDSNEGLVQEIVSVSPAPIRNENGELVQVITRRKTVTGPYTVGGSLSRSTSLGADHRTVGAGVGYINNTVNRVNTAISPKALDGYTRESSPSGYSLRGATHKEGRELLSGMVAVSSCTTAPKLLYNQQSSANSQRWREGMTRSTSRSPSNGLEYKSTPTSNTTAAISNYPSRLGAQNAYQPSYVFNNNQDGLVGNGNFSKYGAAGNIIYDSPSPAPMAPRSFSGKSATYDVGIVANPTRGSSVGSTRTVHDDGVYVAPYSSVALNLRTTIDDHGRGVVHTTSTAGDGCNNFGEMRGVSFGISGTNAIEPSRLSPIQVKEQYAPVKYVTRNELKRMESEREGREPSGGMYTYRPKGYSSGADGEDMRWPQASSTQPYGTYNRQYHQRPYDGQSNRYGNVVSPPQTTRWSHATNGREGPRGSSFDAGNRTAGSSMRERSYKDDETLSLASSASKDNYRRQQYKQGNGNSRNASQGQTYNRLGVIEGTDVSLFGGDEISPFKYDAVRARALNQPTGGAIGVEDLPETNIKAIDVANFLALARGLKSTPPPPEYCEDAMRLLVRGTHLVKYGREGNPHERFLAIRMITPDAGPGAQIRGKHPYLVWGAHGGSAVFKERIHLSHLMKVSTGVDCSENFMKRMISKDTIEGPYLGQQKQPLQATYVFSLRFQSPTSGRTVDLLALDEQTYRCWLLVCHYFACINSDVSAIGHAIPSNTEAIKSESQRSASSKK